MVAVCICVLSINQVNMSFTAQSSMAWRQKPELVAAPYRAGCHSKHLNDGGLVRRVKSFGDAVTCAAGKLALLV